MNHKPQVPTPVLRTVLAILIIEACAFYLIWNLGSLYNAVREASIRYGMTAPQPQKP